MQISKRKAYNVSVIDDDEEQAPKKSSYDRTKSSKMG